VTRAAPEQRNAYKGSPPRPWIRLNLRAADGSVGEVQLLADTGNPCALIIGTDVMKRFRRGDAPDMGSNFGPLTGGWLQALLEDIEFDRHFVGYASDAVVSAAKASDASFGGLAGLPLLRMLEYGGDASEFWVRPVNRP
jgi:hypothetical protein